MILGKYQITPSRFYRLTSLMEDARDIRGVGTAAANLKVMADRAEADYEHLQRTKEHLTLETKRATRLKRAEGKERPDEWDVSDLYDTLSNNTFLSIIVAVTKEIYTALDQLQALVHKLVPGELVLHSSHSYGFLLSPSQEAMQTIHNEMDLNRHAVTTFVSALDTLNDSPYKILLIANHLEGVLDEFYRVLVRRHTVDGVKIVRDPILTDVAMFIYDNIDSQGEIENSGSDSVSAYTLRKAEILADAFTHDDRISGFVQDPKELLNYIKEHLKGMWTATFDLKKVYQPIINRMLALFERSTSLKIKSINRGNFDHALDALDFVDPCSVAYKEKADLTTRLERYSLEFKNDTIAYVAKLLEEKAGVDEVVEYVLKRKRELREVYQRENSFFICKIGQGNPFAGVAPGALEVIPHERPIAYLDEVRGSGFDEVKRFIGQVEFAAKWHDLFLATSPSRTADKSNVLLVGPQGCGKTEILRAVGADPNSISISAQGSDFGTCWANEAQKNPKRLFEAGIKIAKESGRHVNFLIDEIDAILNNDNKHGELNLTLEFQILMDGVVNYPNISVWGATNKPMRIPMPMMRRFSKVVVVGRLDEDDRMALLKHFLGFLPLAGFKSRKDWKPFADQLEGATGDVIRKIADQLWREKLKMFTERLPDKAEELVTWLNSKGKFEVAEMSQEQRTELKKRLKATVKITPKDVERVVEEHLTNIAIHNEIETAVATYKQADEFLSMVKNKGREVEEPLSDDNGDSQIKYSDLEKKVKEEAWETHAKDHICSDCPNAADDCFPNTRTTCSMKESAIANAKQTGTYKAVLQLEPESVEETVGDDHS